MVEAELNEADQRLVGLNVLLLYTNRTLDDRNMCVIKDEPLKCQTRSIHTKEDNSSDDSE